MDEELRREIEGHLLLMDRLDQLEILAKRAYPDLMPSGFCSKHHPKPNFRCIICYPDIRKANDKLISERNDLRAALALANSMIISGEKHSTTSKTQIDGALRIR